MYRIYCSFPVFITILLYSFVASAQNQIQSTGNVGIGTTSPVVRLSVYGTVDDSAAISLQSGSNSRFYIQQGGALLKIGGVTSGNGAINVLNTGRVGIGTSAPATLLDVNGDFRLGVNTGGLAYSIGFTRTGNAQLYGTTATGLALGGDGTGIDAIVLPGGNVGIGTANPTYKLDVQNGSVNIGAGANIAYRAGNYLSMGNASYGNFPYIAFNAFLTTSDIPAGKNLFTPIYNAGGGLIIKGEAGGSGLHFYQKTYNNGTPPYDLTSFTEILTLTQTGAVGIGTTTTGIHRLAVEGSIGARKVKVNQAGWSDFVFQPTYNLLSLPEVENYIKANRHLPDIPTATEVEKNGLDLGEMDRKLLQKIEELTLYLIDMKKEVIQLKKQNESLQQQIEGIGASKNEKEL
ncbi:hypothetical protein ACTJJ0_13075 [Chitinophaga sp. 22321]|uniref:Chaperone of endosialidase n=1 Tax=Chitinophaga hostae TaxID=2831022 RepID=A0ABS5J1C5_9BACT|nr:hypothetical protein [Chitinophaga hostae]MBS0028873.1 hypothetical protein [Chitinophaga hostae]